MSAASSSLAAGQPKRLTSPATSANRPTSPGHAGELANAAGRAGEVTNVAGHAGKDVAAVVSRLSTPIPGARAVKGASRDAASGIGHASQLGSGSTQALEESGAKFGSAASNDYKATFFKASPDLEGKVVVHYVVEQQIMTRYPGSVSSSEMHSFENLRGIPQKANSDLHLSQIRREWNRFYRQNSAQTQQQLLQKATEIGNKFGSQFKPPVGPNR